MVIEKILKKLTPERVKREITLVQRTKLPPELQKWIKEYEKVGERNDFLWKWLYRAFQIVFLPLVSKKYRKSLLGTKLLLTMFITVLNDAGDKKQGILLNELIKIPFNPNYIEITRLEKEEKKHLHFTRQIWNSIQKIINKYPRYKEFEDIFYYDLNQVFNGIKYSSLVNKNLRLINKTEYWAYISHKMMAMVYSTVDLMCSHKFDTRYLGKTREFVFRAQKMARIGNWVSTWEREIKEEDFTSGVFAYAIDSGVLSTGDLKRENELQIIKKIKEARIEEKLLKEWEKYYHEIKKNGEGIKTFKIRRFLSKLEKFIVLHLTSRGYK